MTRGKMILVDKQDNDILLHKTCEFNGDMYIECFGKGIVAELEHIYKYEEFKKYVKYFNDNNFDYGADYFGIYTKVVENKTINVCDNYFENWVDYIRDCISKLEEEYNNEDEEEVEYEPLETLKGVGVKDTDNGLEIMLMGTTSGLLQKYEVVMNIKNYDETDLFNICYEISNEVKNLYYNNNGVPSETQVKEVVGNIMVK